jgi:hypothetical protein
MSFGSRRRLVRSPRRPARTPLENTATFLNVLRHPLGGSPKPPGASGKPLVQQEPPGKAGRKPLVKPIELTPADVAGQELNDTLEKGNTVSAKGRPGVVVGHSRRGGLLVRPEPAPVDLTDRSNRPIRQADRDLPDDDDEGRRLG